jgi:hypothetical protein
VWETSQKRDLLKGNKRRRKEEEVSHPMAGSLGKKAALSINNRPVNPSDAVMVMSRPPPAPAPDAQKPVPHVDGDNCGWLG